MERVLGWVLLAAVVGLVIWVNHYFAAKRREALGGLAASLGLDFDPAPDRNFASARAHGLFRQGRGRRAYNVMRGGVDIDGVAFRVTMGDYRFTTGSGKNRRTHKCSFALLRPPYRRAPDLAIRREHWGDKVLDAIGFDDIDFESEEFSRRFHVKSEDKRFAYAVIHPRMMEFLLQREPAHLEIRGGECLLWESDTQTWEVPRFRAHLDWGRAFFALWPEHLRRELEARPAGRAEA